MNTDDYEGHTEDGPWEVRIDQALSAIFVNGQPLHNKSEKTKIANARLIAAAPLLLEEVKRLRNAFAYAATMAQCSIEDDDFSFHEIRDYCLETCDISIHDAEVMTNNELFGGEEE